MDREETTKNVIVQTYADDMATVIENDTGGLVKKIIHGEEVHEEEKKNLSPESKKNKIFMVLGILLIVFALGVFYYFLSQSGSDTTQIGPQFTPLVFNDQSAFLEVSGFHKDEVAQSVLTEINANKLKNGGLEGIYLTENNQVVGLRRFISLIGSSFIPNTNTLLVSDNFLLGVVDSPNNTQTSGFFILFKMRTVADIFDSMSAWENTMLTDLHGFIGVDVNADTNYLFSKGFDNGVVENQNARILNDNNDKMVLMYIYADDNSVIITNSTSAAHEVISRLSASKKTQ